MKRRVQSQGSSRSKKKKQKDGIRRPLSAYNIYFKLIRPVLIETHERGEKQADFDTHLDSAIKAGKTKAQGALFQAASRTLAERWKNMSPTERDPFELQAQEEMKKYKIQLGAFEMKKVAEEKKAANVGIKKKEAPSENLGAAAAAVAGGTAAAGVTNKGVRQQQSNLSDSETTTISSKSDPANSQGKVFVQQPFNIRNQSRSDGISQHPGLDSNAPNVIATSDDSARDSNPPNQQPQSEAVSRAIATLLVNKLTGNAPNNNKAEDLVQRVAVTALLENMLSDPAALLLVVILLLQSNANQAPPPPPPPANPTVALLASLIQGGMSQGPPPPLPPPPQPLLPGPAASQLLDLFQSQPVAATPVQENTQASGQASLIENLSRLSEQERGALMKIIEGNTLDLSQSTSS